MAYSEPQTSVTRLVGIAFVVLLHALLIYALVTGLDYRATEVVRTPIETRIIEEAKPPPLEALPPPSPQLAPPPPAAVMPPPEVHIEVPPPPPPEAPLPPSPQLAPPPPAFVPPPEVHIETPTPKSTAIPVVTPEKPVAPATPSVAVPVRAMPRLDLQRSEQPEYPPVSRRLGEQGTAVIDVLVGVDGRVLDAKLLQSSGYDRLDQAALAGAKANCRFIPGTVDGKPQTMWFTFKFNWKLQ